MRLRVFAGPNGSGKSTVISKVREYTVEGKAIDFGIYINADDLVVALQKKPLDFKTYHIQTTSNEFKAIALGSGLVGARFPISAFESCYTLRANKLRLKKPELATALAQVIADFLRKKLLAQQERFSFETVFSHASKLKIMRDAREAGYKVYLYFVSTESADINVFRVQSRVQSGGHNVEEQVIRSRYIRSLDFLYEACQLAYQVYFFDNSHEGKESVLFAHFKTVKGKKKWDRMTAKNVPVWFLQYYSSKIPESF